MIRCAALIAVIFWGAGSAWAQAVQQPVVDVFSVDTVVSVPDRGSMVLGGVRSHAQGRATAGPLRSGTAWGQSSAASSSSAHVWIHDFEAMDAALLAEGKVSPEGREAAAVLRVPTTRADLARAHLTRQHSGFGPSAGTQAIASRPLPSRIHAADAARSAAAPAWPSRERPAMVQPLQYNLLR